MRVGHGVPASRGSTDTNDIHCCSLRLTALSSGLASLFFADAHRIMSDPNRTHVRTYFLAKS